MTTEELQACRDGYIYVHDMSARRDTMNCCLFDVANVLTGGFEMGNIWYNEPKTLDVAFDVIGDIVLSCSEPAVRRLYCAVGGSASWSRMPRKPTEETEKYTRSGSRCRYCREEKLWRTL